MNISILLTLKNSTKIVREAVKAFKLQSHYPIEIVIVGLKSDLTLLSDLTKTTKRVKFKQLEFDGDKNDARNLAFKNSTGKYVIVTDYDMIPELNLIEKCLKMTKEFNTLIIPEIGTKSSLLKDRIFALEKKLVASDKGSVTPRFFKKNLFSNSNLPFDKKFGVLDEWGFYEKLKKSNPKIGIVNSYFKVKEEISYKDRFLKNYKKGQYFHNLKMKKSESNNLNPFLRGYNIFVTNISYLFKHPVEFLLLSGLKIIDLGFFGFGYILQKTNK